MAHVSTLSTAKLKQRRAALQQKHQVLEEALRNTNGSTPGAISAMKRDKLAYKDEMAAIEKELTARGVSVAA